MTETGQDIQGLQNAFQGARDEALEMVHRDEKHLRWALGVKIVLLAFVIIYLGWAYTNFRMVDADFIVGASQERFYEALPALKTHATNRLTAMAAPMMDHIGDRVLAAIPAIRSDLETTLKKMLLDRAGPLENDFSTWATDLSIETKKLADDMFPSVSSSYEKITLLREYVFEDFRKGMEEMSYEIGDGLGRHPLIDQLKRLMAGKDLTEKEELQRDLLAIWYLLVTEYTRDFDFKGYVRSIEQGS